MQPINLYMILRSCCHALPVTITMFTLLFNKQLHSQCAPPEAEICNDAFVLCSLDELNGYSCTNNSDASSPCTASCSSGQLENTGWWAFTSDGGQVSITLRINSCTNGSGLQFGIWGDCNCSEEVACSTLPCLSSGSRTITANLIACRTYYLFIGGCNNDRCNFTITTPGGGRPTLSPLGPINNDLDKIIEPICKGRCDFRFFVEEQHGPCMPTYLWELDGQELPFQSSEIDLDFPDEGDFRLCVTAFIGNPHSGSICDQKGPVCATVKVRALPDKTGAKRILCSELIPYTWICDAVTQTDEYRCQIFDNRTCCAFDSVVHFTVLEKPVPGEVYYISCDKIDYVDVRGRIYHGCKNEYEIILPKFSEKYRCDSSILLSAVYPEFSNSFDLNCNSGKVELISRIINKTKGCAAGEQYSYEYNWYLKSDTGKTSLSRNDFLLVDPISETYCVDVFIKVSLGNALANCNFTYCEDLNESAYLPQPKGIIGPIEVCSNKNAETKYQIDLITGLMFNPTWTCTFCNILSGKDSTVSIVKWNIPKGERGKICFAYKSDCGDLAPICKEIFMDETFAGTNDTVYKLEYNLIANDFSTGQWSKISGPGNVVFINPTDPKSRVRVNKFGSYVFRWTNDCPNGLVYDDVNILFKSKRDLPGDKKGNDGGSGAQKIGSRDEDDPVLNYTLFPNPVAGNSFCIKRTSCEWPAHILLLNSQGKFLDSRTIEEGLNNYFWEMENSLPAGIYFLVCTENGQQHTFRFVLM